jgi:hypothetical protein
MTDLWDLAEFRREKLRSWWWSLTEEEREQKRAEFMEKFRTDSDFEARVRKLLQEEEA